MPCGSRYWQIACVMARMCASLNVRVEREPAVARRAERHPLLGHRGVGLVLVVGAHEARVDVDQARWIRRRPARGLVLTAEGSTLQGRAVRHAQRLVGGVLDRHRAANGHVAAEDHVAGHGQPLAGHKRRRAARKARRRSRRRSL